LVTDRASGYPCLLKLSSAGAVRWAIEYAGPNYYGSQNGVLPTSDGGCIVVSGNQECCVERIDGDGKTVWRKTYVGAGRVGDDEMALLYASGIDETPDKGYIVGTIGYSRPWGQSRTPLIQVLLRVDRDGDLVWGRSYKGVYSDDEELFAGEFPVSAKYCDSLTACPDGTYLTVGKSGDSKTTGADMLILRVKADGTVPGFDTPLFPVNVENPPPQDRDGIEMDAQTTTVIGVDTHITAADSLISPEHVRD